MLRWKHIAYYEAARGCEQPKIFLVNILYLYAQIIPCLSYYPAGIMVISVQSTRVKQFLLKRAKFVFCCSKNTTKLYKYR